MTRRRLLPIFALLAALSLVAAACGQKANVHVGASGGAGSGDDELGIGETTPEGDVVVGYDEEGNPITEPADEAGGDDDAGGADDDDDGDTTRTTQRRNTTTTTSPDGTPPTGKVWGKTITIGIHAPITGAAPLPSTFQSAATFVRDYYNAKGGIHGRTLDIQIVDDQYQPAVATQRCSELVKQRNAFLLIGAAGTDQIQACARYAATAGVPYLSAGVTEKGLRTLKNYFAISMSYKQQVPYLVRYMKETFPEKAADETKMYMVYSDTPNFGDALAAWKATVPSAKTIKLSRVPSQSELNAAARELCSQGATLAFPLMAPKDWLFLIGQQACTTIQWSGIGVTMGVNEVAKNGCRAAADKFRGSTFFSPFPGIDKAPDMDPEFKAGTKDRAGQWDDIWVALWGTTKGMVMLLDKVGPNLTRSKFVSTMETTRGLATGLGPVLSYSPSDHFGAREVHVLKARCEGASGVYDTPTTFLKY